MKMSLKAPLPTVNGVGPGSQWLPAGSWTTILDFLTDRFPAVGNATWTTRMAKGQVVDETGLRLNSRSPYRVGACIFYYRELQSETKIPFAERILYRDEHLLIVDKPHFLPVVPVGRFLHETLLVRLKKSEQLEELVPIHRLDRETAGVVMFSLNSETRGHYTALFRNRKVRKVYEAITATSSGINLPLTRRSRIVPSEPFFRMKETEGEPNAETHIDLVESMNDLARYRLRPVTGRKHQLRVHMAALGTPIMNDKLYPNLCRGRDLEGDDDFSQPLQLLAQSISFADPLTGRRHCFESERKL